MATQFPGDPQPKLARQVAAWIVAGQPLLLDGRTATQEELNALEAASSNVLSSFCECEGLQISSRAPLHDVVPVRCPNMPKQPRSCLLQLLGQLTRGPAGMGVGPQDLPGRSAPELCCRVAIPGPSAAAPVYRTKGCMRTVLQYLHALAAPHPAAGQAVVDAAEVERFNNLTSEFWRLLLL